MVVRRPGPSDSKFAEAGGADLIIIYNSGRYRTAGRGSLAGLIPYGDANQIVVDMAGEVLPTVKHTPVLAGVCGTDPFRRMEVFLPQLKQLGFAGVQNFPTVGLIDGVFRQNLEETGMGYGLEVDTIRLARELDMLTCPYVFDEEDARRMAAAGADVLVAHMGLTTKGSIGAAQAGLASESEARGGSEPISACPMRCGGAGRETSSRRLPDVMASPPSPLLVRTRRRSQRGPRDFSPRAASDAARASIKLAFHAVVDVLRGE